MTGRRVTRRRAALLALAGLGATALALRAAADLTERAALRAAAGAPGRPAAGAPGLLARAPRRDAPPAGRSRVAPPSWEPRVLTALAAWVPPPPATPAGRVAAYVWAAPLTLAGLLAGGGALARPRWHEGALVFAPARGPARLLLRARGFGAMALGHVIVSLREPSPGLLAHELAHVRQAERLGPLLAPLYAALTVVYGYARHPMERAARLAQRRAVPPA